jgi:hypothetical protein
MEPKRISPSESLIQSLEMFSQLSVNEFVDLQMPNVAPSDRIDASIKETTTRVISRLMEILTKKGVLELVPNQDIDEINPLDWAYRIKSSP